MLVEPWKVLIEAFRKTFVNRMHCRSHQVRTRPRRNATSIAGIEGLEERTLLTVIANLSGNNVVFQGLPGGPGDQVIFSVDAAGNLEHNLGGQSGFNSSIDLDSSVPGDQTRLVNSLTGLTYTDLDAVPNDRVTFSTDTYSFTNVALSAIQITAAEINLASGAVLTVAAGGTVNFNAARSVSLNTGSSITTLNGDITLAGNQLADPTFGSFTGISLTGASVTSSGGAINLAGRGGESESSGPGVRISANSLVRGGSVQITGEGTSGDLTDISGVVIDSGSTITANGTGTVSVSGTGGGLDSQNHGVFVNNATITSGGGNVQVTGFGGGGLDHDYGVFVTNSAIISAGIGGKVDVTGTGGGSGADGYGVRVSAGGLITSNGGDVTVTGTGSLNGGNRNHGVLVDQSGSRITADGGGTVTVDGTGGGLGSNNVGVLVALDGSIGSGDGDLIVTGLGGGGEGTGNHGVAIATSGGQIVAGGNLTVTGTGGDAAGSSNYGVTVDGVNSVMGQLTGGNATITGMGGGNGNSNSGYGVFVTDAGQIRVNSTGMLSVEGTGSSATGSSNVGVLIDSGLLEAGSGGLKVMGIEGGGSSGLGIRLQNPSTLLQTQNGGEIELRADSLDIGFYTIVDAGTSTVTFLPFSYNNEIDLGSSADPIGGPLSLSNLELNQVTAGTLRIGGQQAGTIDVTSNIVRSVSTDMELIAFGSIYISGGLVNTAGGTLLLRSTVGEGNAIVPTQSDTDAVASTTNFVGVFRTSIEGLTPDVQFTQLNVTGNLDLTSASLSVNGNYTFQPNQFVTIVSASSISGFFEDQDNNSTIDFDGQVLYVVYTSTTVSLVMPGPNTPPEITSPNNASINENTAQSTVVLNVDVTDPDVPLQTLSFSLSGIDAGRFAIDSATGEIRFVASPDFETPTDTGGDNIYNLSVTVDDGAGGTQTQALTITVLPLNDNAPVISGTLNVSVNENTANSVVVVDVDATDADQPPQTLFFNLTGTDAGAFTIDIATGELRFQNPPDSENPADANGDNVYELQVLVSDGAGSSSVEDITVTVLAVNDNDPILSSPTTTEVLENTPPGTVILSPTASDADLPAQTLFFFLSGVDAQHFEIDPSTGAVRFLTSPDYEAPVDSDGNNLYRIRVNVTDGFTLDSEDVTVAVLPVNDASPVFTSPASVTVYENVATSQVVLDVDATDADLPAQSLTYALGGVDAGAFSIDSATGEIRFLLSPDFEVPADADGDNVYSLTVTADDGAGGVTTSAFSITVMGLDDNNPVFTSASAVSVDENNDPGNIILTVNATDADVPAQTVNYSLSGDDQSRFSLDPVTGELQFLPAPDYENPADADLDNVYQLTVTASSGDGVTATQNIAVTVMARNDNTPFLMPLTSVEVLSETAASTVILDADATDADLPAQTLTFSLSGPDAGQFTMDAATGEIRFLASPDYNHPTDADGDNVYQIQVTVTDGGEPPRQSSTDVTITVLSINSPPTATDGILITNEDTPIEELLKGTDPDDEDVLTYGIVTPPAHGTVTILNALTGSYRYIPAPDYNGLDSFTFKLNDGTVDSNTATITVTVNAVNDAPRFSPGSNQTVAEDAGSQTITGWATGIASGPVTATDEVGQVLTFLVVNTNNALFAVQPQVDSSGTLTYTLAPNANGSATVSVTLTDNGGTANGGVGTSTIETFTITVTPVNDPPSLVDAIFSIRENAPAGTIVGTVTATDPDAGDDHTYSITGGNLDGTFAINSATGQITIANNAGLNFDVLPAYNLTIQVRDQANSTATAAVTINLREALVVSFETPVQTFTRSGSPVAIDAGAVARDAEVPNIHYNNGTLTVTNLSSLPGDRLGVLTQGNGPGKISVVFDTIVYQSSLVIIGKIVSGANGSGPLVIQLTSYASEAAVDALLRALSFSSTSKQAGLRDIEIDLRDGSGDERDVKIKGVYVTPVSGLSTFDLPGGNLNYVTSTPPQALDRSAIVTEVSDLMGGRLTVNSIQKLKKQDRLTLLSTSGITVNGTTLLFDNEVIGHILQNSTSLTVDFTTSAATTSAVQALLRSIAFSTTAKHRKQPSRVFSLTLSDGGGNQTTLTKTVTVSRGERSATRHKS